MAQLLDDLDVDLANFLASILKGLEGGPLDADMRCRLRQWMKEHQHLLQIAIYCSESSTCDADVLQECLTAGVDANDALAVIFAMVAAFRRQTDITESVARSVFMSGLRFLAPQHDTGWVRAIWPYARNGSLLTTLDGREIDEVIASLVVLPRIEHEAEEILLVLATRWPIKVVDFFGERLKFSEMPGTAKGYEAIPFQFFCLQGPLTSMPVELVQKVRKWFYDNDELFKYRGATLLHSVFPDFGELEAPLRSLIASGERRDMEFVVAVLSQYNGQPFLHSTCQDIIDALPENDTLLNEIPVILDATGVVSGEFGMVEAYQRKRTDIQPWLNDSRQSVRAFADRHIRSLDRQIAADQRRSMEDLQLRKRQYGEGDAGEE